MSFNQKQKDWILVSLIIISILTVVPFARAIQKIISSTLGRATFGFIVIAALGGAALTLGWYLVLRLRIRNFFPYFFLLLIIAVYLVATIKLWAVPEEAIHFLEYGLLSGAFFRVFRHNLKDWGIHVACVLSGSLVSFADELLQWVLPSRIWDLRDVGLNIFSCVLVQLGLLIITQYSSQPFRSKISSKSIRLVSILLVLNLLIFGSTFSLTPYRLHQLTKTFPFLSFLEKEESLGGLLYRHKDKEIGIFYSPLTINELQRIDALKAKTYSQILIDWKGKDYQKFLKAFPSSLYPFLHEIRVRLFRRDRHLSLGYQSFSLKEKRKHFFIAYKENQILEKYFRQTLRFSSFTWEKKIKEQILSVINPSLPYQSAVGKKFLGTLSERFIWGIILGILTLTIIFNLAHQKKLAKKLR